jgi:hypothetical protein
MPLPLVSRPAAAAAGDDATVTRARRHIEPGHAGGWSSGRRAARSAPGDQPPVPGCAVLAIAAVQGVQIPGVPIPGASTPEASPAAASPQATGVISGPLARRLRHLQFVRKRSRHPPAPRERLGYQCDREPAEAPRDIRRPRRPGVAIGLLAAGPRLSGHPYGDRPAGGPWLRPDPPGRPLSCAADGPDNRPLSLIRTQLGAPEAGIRPASDAAGR